MSTRNLGFLYAPRSVALIGASKRSSSVGAVLARNLFSGGFEGPIMPVNPKHRAIEGVLTYPDVASLPMTPDLAVIATPPQQVPALIAQLGERGTRAAVVITAGFGESQEAEGHRLQRELLAAARPHLLRVVGPNCLGIAVPRVGLDASFAPSHAHPGRLAFVAQSGAVVASVIEWAAPRGIGFSHLVSLGDMADVDFGDMLDYLANDPGTRAILMYVEAVTSARKFMSAARAAARSKPVIVVKAGRHAEGARAVASHTGSLAGADAVYDAVFRRAGMLRVRGLEELFDAVEILAMTRTVHGDRLAILTNGGGLGVLATDALMDEGGTLAELAPETQEQLDAVLPRTWSHANPVDIIGDATGERYAAATRVLLRAPDIDAVLVLNCPTAVASSVEAARAVVEVAHETPERPIVACWVGGADARRAHRLFSEHRIPAYDAPGGAVRGFMYTVDHRRRQQMLMETPASIPEGFTLDVDAARRLVRAAVAAERDWLTEPEAKRLLAAYAIPTVATHTAATPEAAAAFAAELGGPVVVKILSPDITHKRDIGGVVLDVQGPAAARDTAERMLAAVRRAHPEARVDGVTVQPMVRRPGAFELIIGVVVDPQFGPVILFGAGGTEVEVVDDKALGLPPLNMHLARELMTHTRIHRLLEGYRGMPAAHLDAIATTLIKVAQIAIDVPEVVELDINPLLADAYGVVALDARVRVAPASGPPTARLAIRPYPKELEEPVALADGRELLLRPVVPEDEPAFQATFETLTAEERRLRFFAPLKTLTHVMAARFTQIDYDREMALILTDRGIPGRTQLYGVVSLHADPDNGRAEYSILIRGDMTGMGLGILLMRRIIDYARERGIGELYGDVLRDNATMLKLCKVLGFEQTSLVDEPELVRVVLALAG